MNKSNTTFDQKCKKNEDNLFQKMDACTNLALIIFKNDNINGCNHRKFRQYLALISYDKIFKAPE